MLNTLKRAVSLVPGWRTSRKLMVIQSDDWFSIRTPNAAALEKLRTCGARVDECHYMSFDHFEREEDLSALFEILSSVKDHRGRSACLTANCLSANPDFGLIGRSGFTAYYNEPSLATANRIVGAEDNLRLWREAVSAGVCEPQSHGREHLNVRRWISALQDGNDEITRSAFDNAMFGVSAHVVPHARGSFMAAFDTCGDSETPDQEPIIADALKGFESMFGFRSRSFIAPNYVWSEEVERALQRNGVEFIQSGRVQRHPPAAGRAPHIRRRFMGHANKLGQTYLVRNVDFEPSSNPSLNWQDYALSQIDLAFRLRKPAVISTHRVNFMGGLDPSNRDRGLKALRDLLQAVVRRWPSVEFIPTTELGDMIRESQSA